jgi:hypothetical protein
MKIKDISIGDDAYISGILVRDDGTELEFMVYPVGYAEFEFDYENTSRDITAEEGSAIIDVVFEHVGRRLFNIFESINMELQDAEFDLED